MRYFSITALAICMLFFSLSISNAQQFVSFGTGTEGGLYYIWGGGWAKVMNKALQGIEVTAESKLVIRSEQGRNIVDADIEILKEAWQRTFDWR